MGDNINYGSQYYYNWEINYNSNWNLSETVVSYNGSPSIYVANRYGYDGSNSLLQSDISSYQFAKGAGAYYVYGQAEGANSVLVFENGAWQNSTTSLPTLSTSSGNIAYFYVNALSDPTLNSSTVVSGTEIDFSWNKFAGKNVLLVRYPSSATIATLQQGTTYNSQNYGSGTEVYYGSATSFNDVGLTSGTQYKYVLYSENYSYYSPGLVVTPSATPTVTVTGNSTPYTYNGSAQGPNTASNTGTGTSYTFSYVGTGSTTYTASSTQPTNAGTYTVTATVAASGNYAQTSSSATAFTIAQAVLTITANNQSVVYGTAVSTVISNGSYTPTGFKGSDNSSVISGTATYTTNYTATTTVGASGITITPVVTALSATNYTFATANGTITVTGLNESTADFRTNSSGNFSSASTWQYFDGSNWQAATQAPSSNNNITVQNGHNIILDVDYTVGSGKTFTLDATSTLTISSTVVLTIAGSADFAGQSVTVKSDATGTGSIGQISGTLTGASNVTVERYIPADNTRGWRLLSVPTNGSQTIQDSWQAVTWITTGDAAIQSSGGFDDIVTPYTSMQTYNSASGWEYITSTEIPISTNPAYSIYIRGGRDATPLNTVVDPVTLSTTGTIYQGAQSTTIPSGEYSLIGNPYASAIDFSGLTLTGGVANTFYVWDPKLTSGNSLGVYQTFSAGTLPPWSTPIGGGSYGATNTRIESGNAFFVYAPSASGTVQINEDNKVTGSNDVFRPAAPASTSAQLKTNLYSVSGNTASTQLDANFAIYGSAYSNELNNNDALKLSNTGENLAILDNGTKLEVQAQPPITSADTIFYDMWNMQQQQYELAFIPYNLSQPGLTGYLKDSYLGTSTQLNLSDTTKVLFSVDGNASSDSNRFMVVFRPSTVVPISFTGVTAIQQGSAVAVGWKVADEKSIVSYIVERSADGINFTNIDTVDAIGDNGSAAVYSWLDKNPLAGTSYYRIESIGIGGGIEYTWIVKTEVTEVAGSTDITVYPNPITDGEANLKFINQPSGIYIVRLISATGQLLFETSVSHIGGTDVHLINLPPVAQDIYKLQIMTPSKNMYEQKLIIGKK